MTKLYRVKLIGFPEFVTEDGTENTVVMEGIIELFYVPTKGHRFQLHNTDNGKPIVFEIVSTTHILDAKSTHQLVCHIAWWGGKKFDRKEEAISAWEQCRLRESIQTDYAWLK